MFFTEYAIERIGERKTIDIQVLTENLCSLKNRPRTSQYKKYEKSLLEYFEFECIDDEEVTNVDLLLEKNQVVTNLELTRGNIIAFARAGIMVIPRY